MAPKPKQPQHKPIAATKPPRLSLQQINTMMNAKQKRQYAQLYSAVDNRKYVEVYTLASELLSAFPDHTDVLGFKAFAVYHLPLDQIELAKDDFSEAEQKMMARPQQALQVCGLRLMQQAAKLAVGETHLPLQLLANKQRQLGNYREAMQLFDQILKLPAWQSNTSFLKERAVCAIFCNDPAATEYCLRAQKTTERQYKVFCDNCVQLYCTKSFSQTYFEEARRDIHRNNIELRKRDEQDCEPAEASQLALYHASLMENATERISVLDQLANEILDIECAEKMRQRALLELILKDGAVDRSLIGALEASVHKLLARNPDETLQVCALIACLLLQKQPDEFVIEHADKIRHFDVLGIVPDALVADAVKIVQDQNTDAFQKLQIQTVITKAQENEYFEALIKKHFSINNARSLNILERLIDVRAHSEFILKLVLEYLRTNPKKLLFCEAFLIKYTSVDVHALLMLFSSGRYMGHVDDFNAATLENLTFIEPEPQRFMCLKPGVLMNTHANEHFQDAGEQKYWEDHSQQSIQELLLLGEMAQQPESQMTVLKLAVRLDPRDRFLNVRYCEKFAQQGLQYDSLVLYQQFIARNNVFWTALDVQEMNVMLKLATGPASQSILHYVGDFLDYADEAKNSEKIPNQREPIPPPEYTDEERELVSDDEFCCRIFQLKLLMTMLQTFQEQMFDCSEMLYLAASRYQLRNYADLSQRYNDMLLHRPVVQQVVEAFRRVVAYFGALPHEELAALIQKYQHLFQKVADQLWAHHVMLDTADYDRLIDYDPFCFDEMRQLLEKGKMRVSKKVQKFLAKIGASDIPFVQ